MSDHIEIIIRVPKKDIRLPDAEVITFPLVPGEPLDQEVKETGPIEIDGLQYDICGCADGEEEKINQLIKDRFNEE